MNQELLREVRQRSRRIGERVNLVIPSVLAKGETFALRISITGPDALPVATFPETLHFASTGIEGLPAAFRLDPGTSTATISGLTAVGPETARISARIGDDSGFGPVHANPAWVFKTPPYRVFWGDLHVHTTYSNCSAWRCQDPEWCFQYAREISLLDFVAPADHLRGIASDPARWPRFQERCRAGNDPGNFVTFLAFESSHAQGFGGDNNAYMLHDDIPYFWLDREDMRGNNPAVHLKELWKYLDQSGTPYFTAPHHTGRVGKYRTWEEDYHDPQREPLFEIYSSWGSSEMRWSRFPASGGNNDEPAYFTDALKAGARFGVIASSDDHATLPGSVHHFRVDPFGNPTLNGFAHKGLAAVRAARLDRETLFAALRRRDVFATTHVRSLVDLRLGEAGMGQELPADAALRRRRELRLRLSLHGARAARVVLMRNGEPFAGQQVGGEPWNSGVGELVFEDTDDFARVAVRGARYHAAPFVVYYARVEDSNGGHQWTSPIWIDDK